MSSWHVAPGFAKTSPPWATRISWLFLACFAARTARARWCRPTSRLTVRPFGFSLPPGRTGSVGAEVERARPRVVRDLHVEPDVRLGRKPRDPEDVDLERARVLRHEANPARGGDVLDPFGDRHELERDVRVLQRVQGALSSRSVVRSQPAGIRPSLAQPASASTPCRDDQRVRPNARERRPCGARPSGQAGMRWKTTVAARTLRSTSPAEMSLSVTNVIVTAPPSPRQCSSAA